MFLEYCADGDLKSHLEKRGGKLPESEAVQYFRQICEGFKELYKNNIIHRDIKPANILLHKGVAHITDFGFARCLDSTGMNSQLKLTYLGTPLYMSPQILAEENFSSKCDIWSLGMMFYELLYGRTPWTGKTPSELLENIKKKQLEFAENPARSDIVKDMLRKMLVISDQERINWEELFQHKIIKFDNEEVKRNLAEIDNNEGDLLFKSVARNEYYVNQTRVIGVNKKAGVKAFSNNYEEQKQQNNKQEEQQADMQVNRSEKLNIGEVSLIGFQHLLDIMTDKILQQDFTQEQWIIYKESKDYQETLKILIYIYIFMAVILETSIGDLTIDLYTEDAPLASKNFIKLCKRKHYNNALFYDIQKNYLTQIKTKNPTTIYGQDTCFKDEISPNLKHDRIGVVSTSNQFKNQNNSEFFITLSEQKLKHLDGKHSIFGQISEGFEILQKFNQNIIVDE
ncbi:protein kinase domain protein [Ichthyophthirius multifiliis]|uniref:Protein kinase domain protein n=1 Tax=Ichthyophthirius multifiliis TaxID=5932 RepID=G0QK97_ICHMU|nr:protein kinase domain protein [Ichthyophthirius multifiliis]EGR34357.1 protein kinase domain protein [Ichthyophthirius multifiliis]|eukprot:XP_004039661.1 protein kinase domain protein [Ichthyophthirius multifiliis]